MYNPCDFCKELIGVCENCELEWYKQELFKATKPKIQSNIFDKEEIVENATVQILTNTQTGETSVGWWKNE